MKITGLILGAGGFGLFTFLSFYVWEWVWMILAFTCLIVGANLTQFGKKQEEN